jgi:hypothetical protein
MTTKILLSIISLLLFVVGCKTDYSDLETRPQTSLQVSFVTNKEGIEMENMVILRYGHREKLVDKSKNFKTWDDLFPFYLKQALEEAALEYQVTHLEIDANTVGVRVNLWIKNALQDVFGVQEVKEVPYERRWPVRMSDIEGVRWQPSTKLPY